MVSDEVAVGGWEGRGGGGASGPGPWAAMGQALAEIPAARAGWVLVADQDTVVDDMSFALPLEQYAEQELVLYGSQRLLTEDAYQGLLSVSHKDRQQGPPLLPRPPPAPCPRRVCHLLMLHALGIRAAWRPSPPSLPPAYLLGWLTLFGASD